MKDSGQMKENKMGVMPVGKLLINMSLPMMISMLVQALYNIVDSVFVARISEDALSAVSLAFPMQTIMIALAGGTCVGPPFLMRVGMVANLMPGIDNTLIEIGIGLDVLAQTEERRFGIILVERGEDPLRNARGRTIVERQKNILTVLDIPNQIGHQAAQEFRWFQSHCDC